MSPTKAGVMAPEAGFTLVEVLAVLVILALAASAIFMSTSRSTQGAALKSTVVRLASHLRNTRTQAIQSGRSGRIVFDLDQRMVLSGSGKLLLKIPEFIQAELQSATSEQQSTSVGGIRFYPNGRSSGGRVTVEVGNERYEVQVNWLTGRSSVVKR